MFTIKKKITFECSHRLCELSNSPCNKLHGHSYKLWIELSARELDQNGMVIDFSNLQIFKDWINHNFDHALILKDSDELVDNDEIVKNSKIYIMNTKTTAENMSKLFAEKLLEMINNTTYKNYFGNLNTRLSKITVSLAETENNIAEYILTV